MKNSQSIYQILFWVCICGSIIATIIIPAISASPIAWGIPLILVSLGSLILANGNLAQMRKDEQERARRMKERQKNNFFM